MHTYGMYNSSMYTYGMYNYGCKLYILGSEDLRFCTKTKCLKKWGAGLELDCALYHQRQQSQWIQSDASFLDVTLSFYEFKQFLNEKCLL
jgi:hypothetical protein